MSETSSAIDAPRRVALQVLVAVMDRKVSLDQALDDGRKCLSDARADARANARDRAFLTHLVMVCLRHTGEINRVLEAFLDHPPRGRAKVIVRILHLGIAQVLYMDVPGYAAADTSVRLARKAGFSGHAKLVNAIMRRVADRGPDMIRTCDRARMNTPDWLWHSWVAAYGEQATIGIAQVHATEPMLDISLKSGQPESGQSESPEYWTEKLGATVLPTGTLRLKSLGAGTGAIEDLYGYDQGAWWVQDAGAALPVRLMGDVRGKYIADLCAAPGGKTAQLASAGACVTALDRSESRMKRLRENMQRLSLGVETVVADATHWTPDRLLDAVLLDAPCSATGTIRRRPDVMLNKSEAHMADLVRIQQDLLRAAMAMVKPGGQIVYCTCSLQPQEGEDQIAWMLEESATIETAIEIDPVGVHEIPGLHDALRPDGTVRTLPGHWAEHGGIGGFFMARLRKTGT